MGSHISRVADGKYLNLLWRQKRCDRNDLMVSDQDGSERFENPRMVIAGSVFQIGRRSGGAWNLEAGALKEVEHCRDRSKGEDLVVPGRIPVVG